MLCQLNKLSTPFLQGLSASAGYMQVSTLHFIVHQVNSVVISSQGYGFIGLVDWDSRK